MHFLGNLSPGLGVPATDQWSVQAVSHPVTAGTLYITPWISNKELTQFNECMGQRGRHSLYPFIFMVSCNHSINTAASQQVRDPVVNGSSLPWDCIVN